MNWVPDHFSLVRANDPRTEMNSLVVETHVEKSNRERYNHPDTVRYYANFSQLTACEHYLFAKYLARGIKILDVGVGAGRTSQFLAAGASNYVGIDNAQEMIMTCQTRFPNLDFRIMDASDLSAFPTESFDAVIFAFNGIDYLFPDAKRRAFLQECVRVLQDRGICIYSVHNALATLFPFTRGNLRGILGYLRQSITRTRQRIFTRAFWRGSGYILSPDHGGLVTHLAAPNAVIAEAREFGLHLVERVSNAYPHPSNRFTTSWYYYVFTKSV